MDEETELQRHHGACPNVSDNEKWSMYSYQIHMPRPSTLCVLPMSFG